MEEEKKLIYTTVLWNMMCFINIRLSRRPDVYKFWERLDGFDRWKRFSSKLQKSVSSGFCQWYVTFHSSDGTFSNVCDPNPESVCRRPVCLFLCLHVCLPVLLSACPSVHLSVPLWIYVSVFLFLCMCLSVCLSVPLSVSVSLDHLRQASLKGRQFFSFIRVTEGVSLLASGEGKTCSLPTFLDL